jgi:hypothetical protein
MYHRLLAGLMVALLPGLTWADSWKDEGGRRWGWGRRREPHAEPPPQAPARSQWGGFFKHPAPAPVPHGGEGAWQQPPGNPGCGCGGTRGLAAPVPHPVQAPAYGAVTHPLEGAGPGAFPPGYRPDLQAPPEAYEVRGSTPPPPLAAPEPTPQPATQPAPAARIVPIPEPIPSPGAASAAPASGPRPLPRGPAQAPPPAAGPSQ